MNTCLLSLLWWPVYPFIMYMYSVHIKFFNRKTHFINLQFLNKILQYLFDSLLDEFGQDCIVSKTVSEDEQIYITYNGASVTSECSPFSFRTKWWDGESSYKFCVKPVYFEDPDCSVRLTYITSIVGNTLRVSLFLIYPVLDLNYSEKLKEWGSNLTPETLKHYYNVTFLKCLCTWSLIPWSKYKSRNPELKEKRLLHV